MQQTSHHHLPLHTDGFAHPHRNVAALGVEPGMQVADFGSGSGAYTLAIAQQLANSGHVFAIDVQRDLLRRTKNEAHRRGFNNVSIIWTDLERPRSSKIADHALDIVVISNLLFQVQEKRAVLGEAFRILRSGGKLAMIDWSDSYNGTGPPKSDVITKDAALALGKEAGFDLVKEFPAGAHHWGLIMRPILTH